MTPEKRAAKAAYEVSRITRKRALQTPEERRVERERIRAVAKQRIAAQTPQRRQMEKEKKRCKYQAQREHQRETNGTPTKIHRSTYTHGVGPQGYSLHQRRAASRWSTYQAGAKERGLEFLIHPRDFNQLIDSDCYYCGCPAPPKLQGIDRYDNAIGYDNPFFKNGNCVPCCRRCNTMKGTMHGDVFIRHIARIYENPVLRIPKFQ